MTTAINMKVTLYTAYSINIRKVSSKMCHLRSVRSSKQNKKCTTAEVFDNERILTIRPRGLNAK